VAKLRKNHIKSERAAGFLGRAVFVSLALIAILILAFIKFESAINSESKGKTNSTKKSSVEQNDFEPTNNNKKIIYAKGSDGQIVDHKYYSLCYNEDTEQADWVTYKLTRNSLAAPNVDRQRRFNADPLVKTKSAVHKDYSHSGYTRGHMAPAGDMAFNKTAMKETFFMSNMSPQTKELNAGIWNDLEQSVRDWAFDNKEIYITTGPLFYDDSPERIGKTKVAVPDAFYKAILDYEGNEKKSIGFIIPHQNFNDPLQSFAVSIEELERETGLDFFSDVYKDIEEEEKLESNYNIKKWKFNHN